MKLTAADAHAETKLHSAAWNGDINRANELIVNGADINKTDSIGETPLQGAAAYDVMAPIDIGANLLTDKGVMKF